MSAYAEFQQREFASEPRGYTATRHQREVGTGYFDEVAKVVGGGASSTTALTGSTEEAQFTAAGADAGTSNGIGTVTVTEELVVAPPRMPIAAA
jgi:hypothetical protein